MFYYLFTNKSNLNSKILIKITNSALRVFCFTGNIRVKTFITSLKMSITFTNNNCVLLDHGDFVNKLYQHLSEDESYVLIRSLFSIQNIKKNPNRKRYHDSSECHGETLKVKEMYDTFICELPTELKQKLHSKYSLLSTHEVRDLSTKLFESTVFDHSGISGGNNLETPLKCKIKDDCFLIPGSCRFYCGYVNEQCKKLVGNKFDVVIADPPWWNKYIRRLKSANDKLSYNMMYNEEIAAIPIKDLTSDNCLIAMWCTNAPSNIDAIKNLIFPSWGVTYLTTWYWLKVTIDLEPLCPFAMGSRKQPYERLVIGKVGNINVPDEKLIVSVPSALHSHKPPLLDLLKCYTKEDPQVLELFARYLLPNTTSIGFEPLKWQHISLYNVLLENK